MKNILITQSLYKDKNNTVYTRLDYDWYKYADKLKFNLLPIPFDNKMKFLSSFLKSVVTSMPKTDTVAQ